MQSPASPETHLKSKVAPTYVEQLADHFQTLTEAGKVLYFVSCTYVQSKAIPLTVNRASYHLKRVHRKLLEYLCGSRNWHRPWFRQIEPQVYAFLDIPGSKPKHYLYSGTSKDGSSFHHHCVLVADRAHAEKLDRLTEGREASEFADRIRSKTGLRTIDVQKVGPTPEDIARVVDYASSWSRRRENDCFALEIYPSAKSER